MTAPAASPLLDPDSLEALEAAVGRALHAGNDSGLDILGYGEISLVVGWPTGGPTVAAKRLPVFPTNERAEGYGELVAQYLDLLPRHGVTPVRSEYACVPCSLGQGWAAYVVQPILPSPQLAPNVLRSAGESDDRSTGEALLEGIVEAIVAAVDRELGLDGQLSNWARTESGLVYFDVTTPLLTDDAGRSRLDLGLLTSPLPAVVRAPVRRLVAPGLTARYHNPRDVLVDLAGNLIKERLDSWLPVVLELAAPHLEQPITEEEVRKYYRSDAVTWELLLRLRRIDRSWQRRVRRRPYPTLLPHDISR